jgi:hydroxymethylpyrimidine/phosphomethylpyrimidine kinase
MTDKEPKVCLTIAGLDPSGGAGIVADIKTFTRFGCFSAAAITSVTFQNTTAVFGAVHQSGDAVRRQVEPVFDDYDVAAVKTGMLPTGDVIETVADVLAERGVETLVVDPVVRSTSGFDLIDDQALRVLITKLFPIATVVTPNIPEAERIAGLKITSEADIVVAARRMSELGAKNVLIKGGHFRETAGSSIDHLFTNGEHLRLETTFIDTTATHGTGCTLAAAITAGLALGKDLFDAVEDAKAFVHEAIRTAPMLGKGNSPIKI